MTLADVSSFAAAQLAVLHLTSDPLTHRGDLVSWSGPAAIVAGSRPARARHQSGQVGLALLLAKLTTIRRSSTTVAMEEVVARVGNVVFELEVALDRQLGALPLPFPGMDKSGAAVCCFYLKGSCSKGSACPFRHVKGDRTVVCKHWLRGLCKKGDQCEFLHEFDMTKMPECYFYSRFNACCNKDPASRRGRARSRDHESRGEEGIIESVDQSSCDMQLTTMYAALLEQQRELAGAQESGSANVEQQTEQTPSFESRKRKPSGSGGKPPTPKSERRRRTGNEAHHSETHKNHN
ncbi:hypothetical protein HPB52_005180 [Rhipicephalus sanguineus]|uniref:C3H1-type domain-containing protein n=1 Tax=Rhipicephalus sanguineus TaxID=34632 RepID=A0A9D4PYH7_RHISA|nr:hypothetical protein HPB52_005180 [Rhipicephalus sanguineus]